jgi:hypothetical protein
MGKQASLIVERRFKETTMKRTMLALLLLSLGLGAAAQGASAAPHNQVGTTRMHFERALADGSKVVFTTVTNAPETDAATGFGKHSSLLFLESSVFGRWTVHSTAAGSSQHDQWSATYEFKRLDTGESLQLRTKWSPQQKSWESCVTFNGESATLTNPDGQTNGASSNFLPLVHDRASDGFRKGLFYLRSLALTTPQANLSTIPFDMLWGATSSKLGEVPQVTFQLLPVDCAFDAAFGYPCLPDEKPSNSRGTIYKGSAAR